MTRDVLETAFASFLSASSRSVWAPVPLALIALWAVLGVFAIAFAVRLHSDHFGTTLGAGLIALGGAGLVLMCTQFREPPVTRTLFVDEAVRDAKELHWHQKRLDVLGTVVPGSIEQRYETDEYRFRLASGPQRPHAVMEVRYTGLLPDAFRVAALDAALIPLERCRELQVVVHGTIAADGHLDAIPDGLLTKSCCD